MVWCGVVWCGVVLFIIILLEWVAWLPKERILSSICFMHINSAWIKWGRAGWTAALLTLLTDTLPGSTARKGGLLTAVVKLIKTMPTNYCQTHSIYWSGLHTQGQGAVSYPCTIHGCAALKIFGGDTTDRCQYRIKYLSLHICSWKCYKSNIKHGKNHYRYDLEPVNSVRYKWRPV